MAATQRLELRQAQSLVMTPQLQQAIKLLQLSNIELAAYVEGELERNPLLERDDGMEDRSEGETTDRQNESAEIETPGIESEELATATRADTLEQTLSERLPVDGDAPLDTDFANLYTGAPADGAGEDPAFGGLRGSRANVQDAPDQDFVEQRLAEKPTLRQHLLNQLQLEVTDPATRIIGLHLIEMLDEAGYLSGELTSLADTLGCPLADIETTLAQLQRFDPAGIFARSLQECLALQLADRNRYDPAMAALLDNLDLLAARDLAGLRRVCGVDDEDLSEMIAEIRALDPKPGASFEGDAAEPVVPDILMYPGPKGAWQIELNAATLPRVLVNGSYHATIRTRTRSKAERDYVAQQFQSANWLVKALHQRATTILKVASEIVRQQDGFFRKGVQEMRPLTLRAVAEAIEMHESTVSRVTANKYIATPRGIFEMRFFFSSSIGGVDGGSHSAEAVRHRIRNLIDQENCKKILSDDHIVTLLKADGIDIARRTVAKYREAMRIPSSVERRRQKSMAR